MVVVVEGSVVKEPGSVVEGLPGSVVKEPGSVVDGLPGSVVVVVPGSVVVVVPGTVVVAPGFVVVVVPDGVVVLGAAVVSSVAALVSSGQLFESALARETPMLRAARGTAIASITRCWLSRLSAATPVRVRRGQRR